MLESERDNLINLFKIDNCIKRYKIIKFGFKEDYYIDTSIENFINNCICVDEDSDGLITKEYADFVNCILDSYILKLNDYLGKSNTSLIINKFRIEDYKLLSWTSILQHYMNIINSINSQTIQYYHENLKCDNYCVAYEIIKEFAKTLTNLILDINNILGRKIENHNNHNIELLRKAAINKLSNSFEVGNFIEPFKSEVLPYLVIDELKRFFNIENCIKSYMPTIIGYDYNKDKDMSCSRFIDEFILNDYIKDYDLIARKYIGFVNYCVCNVKRVHELRSIIKPIDDTNTKLADNVIDKLKKFLVWKSGDRTWDDLLNHYYVLVSRSTYESDRLASDPNIFSEVICTIFATQLYNFVYDIKSRSQELKKINKFRQLDFTHGIINRSVLTEEKDGFAVIDEIKDPEPKLVGIKFADIKERRNKIMDRLEHDMLFVHKNIDEEYYTRLFKSDFYKNPENFLNTIGGGNNNMNQKAFTIKDIIFSGDRTIALWENGDKTIVRIQDDESVYDPEKAIMALFMKRVYEMYNLPARQKNMNKDLDKYLAKYNEHKDEIAAYLTKKNKKTTDNTNKAE